MLFHIIEDAHAILYSRGVYRQSKVYSRGVGLYAGFGSGFIRLSSGGNTSKPDVRWNDIDIPYQLGQYERLEIAHTNEEPKDVTPPVTSGVTSRPRQRHKELTA